METVIITAGSYDMFHFGHYRMLQRCKHLGNIVVLLLSTDEFGKEKGKTHYNNYEKRKEMIQHLCPVNNIIPEESWQTKYNVVKEYMTKYDNVLFVMGDDWAGKFNDLPCEVFCIKRTPGISTTLMKEKYGVEK